MNFLAHYLLATRFLTPAKPLSAFVVGTALPDLLPLAAPVRLRPVQIAPLEPRTEFEAAMSVGVSVHLATDAAFHKAAAFAEAQAEVSRLLAATAFNGIRVRRFFAAHVLTEIALDAVLLRSDPTLADDFYSAFTSADFTAVTHWAEGVTGKSLSTLSHVLTRFAKSEYLRQYATDTGVAIGFSNLCRRARQDPFEDDNFTRLTETIRQIVQMLPKYVPRLLSETIVSLKKEDTDAAANATSNK